MTAHRTYIARAAVGSDDLQEADAIAGAVLEAEAQHDLRALREMYEKVHAKNE